MQNASYTKLRDGSWGIRVISIAAPVAGDQIVVTTKAGSHKMEVIGKILWSGPDKSIVGQIVTVCAVEQRARPIASVYSHSASRVCKDCGAAPTQFNRIYGNGQCRHCWLGDKEERDMGY